MRPSGDTDLPDETPSPNRERERELSILAALDDILAGRETGASVGADADMLAARVAPKDLRLLLAIRALAAEHRAAAPEPASTPPARIGRFTVGAEIGRGGFAVVYAATDPTTGRRVAIKLLRPESLLSAAKRRRFEREAGLCARLEHPAIVPLIEVGIERDQPFIISELCEGGSLAGWLERHPGPLPGGMAAGIVARLAGAVDHAHRRSILHRDITPANVFLVPATPHPPLLVEGDAAGGGWGVKLGDFGLGKLVQAEAAADQELLSDFTRPGTLLGSPEWMAPEQVDSAIGPVGPATDIHALGLVLDRLLTGRSRHAGERPSAAFRRLRNPLPVTTVDDPPGIAADLLAIRRQCLARRPEDRPASAAALAARLDAVAAP
jgi:serine/threonine protein kinase